MRSSRGKNGQEQTKKKKYSGQQRKKMDCDEPHLVPNEETKPIQWTERPTGALVAAGSLWPQEPVLELVPASNLELVVSPGYAGYILVRSMSSFRVSSLDGGSQFCWNQNWI